MNGLRRNDDAMKTSAGTIILLTIILMLHRCVACYVYYANTPFESCIGSK